MSTGTLSEFSTQIMKTLMDEMTAIDSHGHPDHKTRISALKEARSFVIQILPKMSPADRETFSHAMASQMTSRLSNIIEQEKVLAAISQGEDLILSKIPSREDSNNG